MYHDTRFNAVIIAAGVVASVLLLRSSDNKLCDNIISGQHQEIDQMNAILPRLSEEAD